MDIVQNSDKQQAAAALEAFCARYWYPIYAYLRHSGQSAHDAEDITQSLFERLLKDEALQKARPEKGRLRFFLLAMVSQVISRKTRHENAAKRGGGAQTFSLDEATADERYAHEFADTLDPERLFHRAWARQLLESVREHLRASFIRTGRVKAYEHLEPYLGWDDSPAPFAALGELLGCSEEAARVTVHRLRKKFRELLEKEIAKTVSEPGDVQEELEWLREALRA